MKRALFLLAGVSLGCAASTPPAGWQQGGTPLMLARATWTQQYAAIELLPDGRVLQNGRVVFALDGAGRVFDLDGQPVALLRPDGRLLGNGDVDMGAVGPTSAALPGQRFASIAIAPSGEVVRYDEDGERASAGAWAGCGAYAMSLQACMLVTLLVSTKYPPYRPMYRYPYPGGYGAPYGGAMMPGYGLGLGVPVR